MLRLTLQKNVSLNAIEGMLKISNSTEPKTMLNNIVPFFRDPGSDLCIQTWLDSLPDLLANVEIITDNQSD